jgi:hypothetical protein
VCYLAILAAPTLDQWDVFDNADSKCLAHFDNLVSRFVIPANIVTLAGCLRLGIVLKQVPIAFVHPSGFDNDNQLSGFCQVFRCPYQFKDVRKVKRIELQVPCLWLQHANAGLGDIRVNGDDDIRLLVRWKFNHCPCALKSEATLQPGESS